MLRWDHVNTLDSGQPPHCNVTMWCVDEPTHWPSNRQTAFRFDVVDAQYCLYPSCGTPTRITPDTDNPAACRTLTAIPPHLLLSDTGTGQTIEIPPGQGRRHDVDVCPPITANNDDNNDDGDHNNNNNHYYYCYYYCYSTTRRRHCPRGTIYASDSVRQ